VSRAWLIWLAMPWLACGSSSTATRSATPGDTHAPTGEAGDVPVAGSDRGAAVDGVEVGDGIAPDASVAPAVTFHIVNTGTSELSFSQNKGWQPVIFAWSGERGKGAKPLIMFEKFCTASCDAAADAVCPSCPVPETNRAAREAQQYAHVPAGESLDVPWDGLAFVYDKTHGTTNVKRTRCECYRRVEPSSAQYTVMACGQRLTAKANQRSAHQCVEATMSLPRDEPIVVTFEFPDPPRNRRGRHR